MFEATIVCNIDTNVHLSSYSLAPEGVTFGESSANTTAVTVTWIALAGADGFRVACSEGAPSPSSPLPGSATDVTCDGVTPGGNHSVSVVTQENNGESPTMVVYIVACKSLPLICIHVIK